MQECRWPRGCWQWCDSGTDLCYVHLKRALGLIDAPDQTKRRGLSGSDVVSDEQREIASILRKLGAPPDVIQRAMTREAAS